MKYITFLLPFFIVLPFHTFAQDTSGGLSGSDIVRYKMLLKEKRSIEAGDSGNVQPYSDDRNTKVRKLSESINFQEKEARIAKEQATYERLKEKEDLKIAKDKKHYELVDKGASAKTDEESSRYYKGARELKDTTPRQKKSIGVSYR